MNGHAKRDTSDSEYSISDLSAEFDITPRTLRWYETEGLLAPNRRGSRRIYTIRDRTRLRLILRGKRIGFSLADIHEIIDMYDAAPGEQGQLAALVARIEVKRDDLKRRHSDIERTLAELDDVEARARERLTQLARQASGSAS
jgi:DNA-binding transcriptional MerR regulator